MANPSSNHLPVRMTHDAMLRAYADMRPELETRGHAFVRQLEDLVSRPAADRDGVKLHALGMRTKEPDSLARKLARPDRTYGHLWEITDLVGIRIITYFDDEVDHIGRLIEAHLPVDFQHSIDKRRLRNSNDHGRFGYRSLHYICHMGPLPHLADSPAGSGPRLEIQVRTLLEHAWAEIEHDLGYKSRDAMPSPVRRRLHRLAGLLELADQEFAAIRMELRDYARALPERIAAAEALPLDRLSVEGLLACDESLALDTAIADRLGKSLGNAPFFPDYLVRMLRAAGLQTVAEVRAGLIRHAPAIRAMVAPYFAFSTRTWDLSPDNLPELPRGYAVFFLAHAHILAAEPTTQLAAPALALDRVMRLARFYGEIDYPHDEREGQRIASLLHEAFRDIFT